MGRLDLPDKRRDEDEFHPEDRDARLGISPSMRARIDQIKADPSRRLPKLGVRHAAYRPTTMTDRRLQVLKLVARGHTNPEIADSLEVSTETVKAHMRLIFELLDARSRAHAVAIAYELELFELGTVST